MHTALSRSAFLIALVVLTSLIASAQAPPVVDARARAAKAGSGPRVLIAIAHPDDESGFSGAVYKLTHDLGATVDLALVTNGEGGYKYSTLAEDYYGLELTDEAVGREHLPRIRKRELMAAGEILGIRSYFFLDQVDHRYTLNVDSVLQYVWDVPSVRKRFAEIIAAGDYDYILCLLPTPDTHGHHKGASILALEVVAAMPLAERPVVLGGGVSSKSDTVAREFNGLDGYPVTKTISGTPTFTFDRTQKFGFRNALDYKIIVNWEIAEHKSQGSMQTLINMGDYENFWWFAINNPERRAAAAAMFEELKVNRYPTKKY